MAEQAAANERLLTRLRQLARTDPGLGKGRPEDPSLTPDQAQELLGQRYRVVRKVGQGAASCVFQAEDGILARQVAVKFLRGDQPDRSSDWQEARLMGQLNHPYVAQIHEIGRAGPYRFMVMEWVEGLPLARAWAGLADLMDLRDVGVVELAHQPGLVPVRRLIL